MHTHGGHGHAHPFEGFRDLSDGNGHVRPTKDDIADGSGHGHLDGGARI